MSSKAGKMEKQVLKNQMPPQKTKSVIVRVDTDLYKGTDVHSRSVIMEIAGVPQDLPEQFENTILKTAERQFSNAVNARLYIETFDRGSDGKEQTPVMYNLSRLDAIKIVKLEKISEINDD